MSLRVYVKDAICFLSECTEKVDKYWTAREHYEEVKEENIWNT